MNRIISYKDNRYIIKRIIKNEPEDHLDFWKAVVIHDLVLKKNDEFWFLQEITEVNILKETKNGSE